MKFFPLHHTTLRAWKLPHISFIEIPNTTPKNHELRSEEWAFSIGKRTWERDDKYLNRPAIYIYIYSISNSGLHVTFSWLRLRGFARALRLNSCLCSLPALPCSLIALSCSLMLPLCSPSASPAFPPAPSCSLIARSRHIASILKKMQSPQREEQILVLLAANGCLGNNCPWHASSSFPYSILISPEFCIVRST